MKKLLMILCWINPSAIFAQTTNLTRVLPEVADLAAFADRSITTISITDTKRGGEFHLYLGKDATDNGMIFNDAAGNKWKRKTIDKKINVQWYGAVSSAISLDVRDKFIAARDYIYLHPTEVTTLYIPADTAGYSVSSSAGYYIADSILFNKAITIEGDNSYGGLTSTLRIPTNKKGLVFQYKYGENGFGVTLKNFAIRSGTPDLNYTDAHAIVIRCKAYIENVYVRSVSGDGLHISACATPSAYNYGNADASVAESFTAKECRNGIFVEGCDANTIGFYNIDCTNNRRWNVYDNGLLGNFYSKPHLAAGGRIGAIPSHNGSVVLYKGKYYAAKPGFDGYVGNSPDSNYNKNPLDSTRYWYEVSPQSGKEWDAAYRYYSGGPLAVTNINSFNTLTNVYTEAFQPPIWLNGRSKLGGGGDVGSGSVNGYQERISLGQVIHLNANHMFPNGTSLNGGGPVQRYMWIGSPAYNYRQILHVYNDERVGVNYGLRYQSSGDWAFNAFENTSGTAYYGIYKNEWRQYMNGKILMQLTASTYNPFADNSIDLGAVTQRWKNAYVAGVMGIGTTAVTPSAKLELASTTQGFLPPRMTAAQASQIKKPAEGLMVYITDSNKIFTGKGWWGYNGSFWEKLNN